MTAPVSKPADNVRSYAAQRSFREVCQDAMRVFSLMGKYRTAPYPNAYAVWFAYASGSDEALTAEIDNLLLLKDALSPFDIESLHHEYLAADSGIFATQDIGQAIGDEIGAVLGIIEQGLKQNDEFTHSLDTFAARAPEAASGESLAAAVAGLLAENRRMAELTRDLNQGLARSQSLITVLNHQLDDVQAQNLRDQLTGVGNRRAFEKALEDAANRAGRTKDGLCVALGAIDDFKAFCDIHGPDTGDALLKAFADGIASMLGHEDRVARYSADEFALILPGRDLTAAYNFLITVRHRFRQESHSLPDATPIAGVTVSFGVARLEPGMTANDVREQAVSCLLEARRTGPNLVKASGIA